MPNELKPCNYIKPCPFCGCDVVLSRNFEGQWKVYCTNCECICYVGNLSDANSVRVAWNRRSDNGNER